MLNLWCLTKSRLYVLTSHGFGKFYNFHYNIKRHLTWLVLFHTVDLASHPDVLRLLMRSSRLCGRLLLISLQTLSARSSVIFQLVTVILIIYVANFPNVNWKRVLQLPQNSNSLFVASVVRRACVSFDRILFLITDYLLRLRPNVLFITLIQLTHKLITT